MSGFWEWMSSSLDTLLCRGAGPAAAEEAEAAPLEPVEEMPTTPVHVPPRPPAVTPEDRGMPAAMSRTSRMRWQERAESPPPRPPPIETEVPRSEPPMRHSPAEVEAERLHQLELEEEQEAIREWRMKKQEEIRQMAKQRQKAGLLQAPSPPRLSSPPPVSLQPAESPESMDLCFSPEPAAAVPKSALKAVWRDAEKKQGRSSPPSSWRTPNTPSPPQTPMVTLQVPGTPPPPDSPGNFKRQMSTRGSRASIGSDTGHIFLPSVYERLEKSKKTNGWETGSDAGSVVSDASYQEQVRNARGALRVALVAERKALSNGDRSSMMMVRGLSDRIEHLIKDLTRRGREEKIEERMKSMTSNNSLGSPSPGALNPNRSSSWNASFMKSTSGVFENSSQGNDNNDEEDDDLDGYDYDSDDEDAMEKRYKVRCSPEVVNELRGILIQEGHAIPKERANSDDRAKRQFQKMMKQEVSTYQDMMKERLDRLGAGAQRFKSTASPSEAVKDAVLKYHMVCEKLGHLYAFEKPKSEKPSKAQADMPERRQISRFVRDLKEQDPDRYKKSQSNLEEGIPGLSKTSHVPRESGISNGRPAAYSDFSM